MEDKRIPKSENESIDNKIEDAIINEQNTLPYNPISKLPSLGTMIPLALAGETLAAQYKFKEDIPNIDEYLIEKLQYSSKLALSDALAAEQADAVGMAIYQFEKDKGLILADMAGIGKGRVNAAILRYAYVNGHLPVFITEKPNLFSAIYRDIKDIGGIATKNGQPYFGKPLILNGYKSGGVEKTYDERGKLIRKKKPSETGIIDRKTGLEIITAPEQDEIKKIIKGDDIPKEFDMIFMTYSQLMEEKVNYLHKIMFKRSIIFSMDEVHNAAGAKSSVGVATQGLLGGAKGALYSSATFSKRPDNMYLYALKTDVSESPLKTDELIDVIKGGGERLTEFMAANIVASGQMLRREKTYDNCTVMYEYMSEADKNSSFEKYDLTIKYYRKIIQFFDVNQNLIYAEARQKAIDRFVKESKVVLARKKGKDQSDEEWRRANKGKFFLSKFTLGDVTKSQFNFIESLLFSLKADFVTQQTLGQIQNNQLESISTETKQAFKSNRKPIIAVRNTLEGIYANLGYEVGDTIDKDDFSLYLLSFVKNGLSGTIELKEVVERGGKPKKYKDAEFEILDSDFSDGGASYKNLIKEIDDLELNLPLSPIDRIINTIQATDRESWDNVYNKSPKYVVGEVTGRKFRLVKQADGKFKLELNPRDKNKASAFKKFNDGVYDVLLINESGSTGEDAHSSRNFKDTRPRCMIIHQVELDVNTEVQKRGRINRTGMINYPTYIYAVSRIPSEIRRLLMLAKKMRSLDANTTANQKQSSKLSEIRDKYDNPIADIMNQYGDEVLSEFLTTQEGQKFLDYKASKEDDKLEKFSNQLEIEGFMRRLELADSADQQEFYDSMNPLYLDYIQKLKNEGTYDLETEMKDLKGVIKNRAVISRGLDTSPFNSSVYEEDNYVFAEDKPLDKGKIEDTIAQLAKGKRDDVFYKEFLDDFKKHYEEYQKPAAIESVSLPDYKLARDEKERQEMKLQYETMVAMRLDNLKKEHEDILEILEILKPNLPCLIPANVDECYETDDDGFPVVPKEKNKAKFLGVKLLSAAKDKYSAMNIELVFAQLSGRSKVTFKPTKRGRQILEWIVVWLRRGLNIVELQEINNWYVDPNRREMMRLLTGDILSAYKIAKERVNTDDSYTKRIEFLKFTTADESAIRFGIRIYFRSRFVEIDPKRLPVTYPLNSPFLIESIKNSYEKELYIKTFNNDVTFMVQKVSWSDCVEIRIFGGTYGKQPKDKTKAKYLSKVYNNADLELFLKDNNYDYFFEPYSYKPITADRAVTLNSKKFFFWVDSDDSSYRKMSELFEKIYELQPFNLSIQGSFGAEAISGRSDIALDDMEGVEEEAGTFKYHLLVPYQVIEGKLSGFSKFDSFEKGEKGYGTVTLNRRANAIESTTYSLMPLESTAKNMITDTLSLFSDNDRLNFNQEIKKLIADGKSDVEIGMFVEEKVIGKVLTLKNIFGKYYDDYEFIGKLFRDFEEGKIEEFKLPEKAEGELDYEEEVVEDVPLSYGSAQDFIISLISKIK
jgi:hypothetical protein